MAVERPIIFSTPMVRAILAGQKVMTRRIIKPQPFLQSLYPADPSRVKPHSDPRHMPRGLMHWCIDHAKESRRHAWEEDAKPNVPESLCPYGQKGDRLWVRESYAIFSVDTGSVSVGYKERLPPGKTIFDTDGGLDVIRPEDRSVIEWASKRVDTERWRPSIFMPRWASRITLEVAAARVECLHDISEEDALREGVSSVDAFSKLWDSLHGCDSWQNNNPWVWVVSLVVSDICVEAETAFACFPI